MSTQVNSAQHFSHRLQTLNYLFLNFWFNFHTFTHIYLVNWHLLNQTLAKSKLDSKTFSNSFLNLKHQIAFLNPANPPQKYQLFLCHLLSSNRSCRVSYKVSVSASPLYVKIKWIFLKRWMNRKKRSRRIFFLSTFVLKLAFNLMRKVHNFFTLSFSSLIQWKVLLLPSNLCWCLKKRGEWGLF